MKGKLTKLILLLQSIRSVVGTKWMVVFQMAALVLPAVIALEANRLKFPFSDLKAMGVVGLAYLGGVIWVIRGKSKERDESERIRPVLVWLLTKPLPLTLVVAVLAIFSIHLLKRVRYHDLSEAERAALTTWSNQSVQTLDLLKEEFDRWEIELNEISEVHLITSGPTGLGKRDWSTMRDSARVRQEVIDRMQELCKEIGAIARFEPNGRLFGEYERPIKFKALATDFTFPTNRSPISYLHEALKFSGTGLLKEMPLREQALLLLQSSGGTNLTGHLSSDMETFVSFLRLYRKAYVDKLAISVYSPDPNKTPNVLEGFSAFYISQKINEKIDRRRRIRVLLNELSLLTDYVEHRLRTRAISSQEILVIDQRLHSIRSSLLQ